MQALEEEAKTLAKSASLRHTVQQVDSIIAQLEDARRAIAQEPSAASITLAKLQNPLKQNFEKVDDSLKAARKSIDKYGKALTKKLPKQGLSSSYDALASQTALIDRAVAMHFLREGQFDTASVFLSEALNVQAGSEATPLLKHPHDDPSGFTSAKSHELQSKFVNMYSILDALKQKDLLPAIEWASINSQALEASGSNLEFALCRLQFMWLFQGPEVNGLPAGDGNGLHGALRYAQVHFPPFQKRYLKDIQQLVTAMAYGSNLSTSPYHCLFDIESAWSEIASFFTREFCSLLGLSASSPLFIATTAGVIALPMLLKLADIMKTKRTEWTSQDELPVEIPLPESMLFHAIFVCPVSKEQTTEQNPPMMMPCGHVIAKESLQRLSKGGRFKCPYCPNESQSKDAREIFL